MTATHKTLLVLGLTVLAMAASNPSALADGCEATCEAGCGNPGYCEVDPRLGQFGQDFCDLSRRCAACAWRFDASVIYLHRANPSSVTLLSDATSGAVFLNSADLDFPYRVGPRLDFVVTDCAGLGLELNYFSVDGWSTSPRCCIAQKSIFANASSARSIS